MIRNEARLEQLLDQVRDWVREVAIPNESRVESENEIPAEIVADMRTRGFFGWSIPEEYGGAGLTTEELVMAAMELSQASTAFRARVGSNTGVGSEGLVVDGTPEQKARYLPLLATGDITGCFALTEPEAGSDATSLRTSATRDGAEYVLNGTKRFITNAPIAELFTVLARTDPNDSSSRGISGFLVERGTPGLTVGKPYRMMGQAGSPVSEVYFEDCRVPAENLIGGQEGIGFRTAMKVLNKQRIHLSALCTGPAIRMLNEAVEFSRRRRQFGRPISEYQLVQAMIADCQAEVHAARALILETARKRDADLDTRMEASICKYFASEMCGRVADRAVQIFGGEGYVADYACIERLYRDVRVFRLYEGTSEIHQVNIARMTLQRGA
ncbi:MAG: acyl-CoA dehydrogenase family protein [Ectothiorhodospiraceae bacterium]|nr:acyl-CoA dehydrogenase family protein [Ectothiorhodospiraceae bacterium]